ncbi:MAG: ribonuclease P protein component [Coprobacillus sp.]|nr:ribonuclease P protein component [Coprobacillus sp.]
MKREFRLLKERDYTLVIQNGKTINTKSYVIHYLENKDVGNVRIGVTTSKKTGNAVTRNKVKRQVKAMLDHRIETSRELDVVIIIKKNYLNYNFQQNAKVLYEGLSEIERLLTE